MTHSSVSTASRLDCLAPTAVTSVFIGPPPPPLLRSSSAASNVTRLKDALGTAFAKSLKYAPPAARRRPPSAVRTPPEFSAAIVSVNTRSAVSTPKRAHRRNNRCICDTAVRNVQPQRPRRAFFSCSSRAMRIAVARTCAFQCEPRGVESAETCLRRVERTPCVLESLFLHRGSRFHR